MKESVTEVSLSEALLPSLAIPHRPKIPKLMTMFHGLFCDTLRLAAVAIIPLVFVAGVFPAAAEEGGSGHYLPGSMASFVDSVPPAETFILRYNLLHYKGDYNRGKPLPIAGISAAGVEAESWAHGLTLLWRPPLELGEGLSYAMSATIPFVWMDVSANVTADGVGTYRRSDNKSGLGDIVLMPVMLNYTMTPDLSTNFRLGIYAPTGSYKVGRLANTGKNFWTFEPTIGLMYFGQKNGREATLFAGADFNTENNDTDYKSGTQLHFDGTLAQHFPLWGGLAGAGLNGYWYKQVTGDSGSGANFGDFKGKTVGIGPVASYVSKVEGKDVIAELKWLHETDTERRLEGDIIWFKAVVKF